MSVFSNITSILSRLGSEANEFRAENRRYWDHHSLAEGYSEAMHEVSRYVQDGVHHRSDLVQGMAGAGVGVAQILGGIPISLNQWGIDVTNAIRRDGLAAGAFELVRVPVQGMVDSARFVRDSLGHWRNGSLNDRNAYEIAQEVVSVLGAAGMLVMGARDIHRGGGNFLDGMGGASLRLSFREIHLGDFFHTAGESSFAAEGAASTPTVRAPTIEATLPGRGMRDLANGMLRRTPTDSDDSPPPASEGVASSSSSSAPAFPRRDRLAAELIGLWDPTPGVTQRWYVHPETGRVSRDFFPGARRLEVSQSRGAPIPEVRVDGIRINRSAREPWLDLIEEVQDSVLREDVRLALEEGVHGDLREIWPRISTNAEREVFSRTMLRRFATGEVAIDSQSLTYLDGLLFHYRGISSNGSMATGMVENLMQIRSRLRAANSASHESLVRNLDEILEPHDARLHPALEVAERQLRSEDWSDQLNGALALARTGDPAARAVLESFLEQTDSLTFDPAVEALGNLGDRASAPVVLRWLEEAIESQSSGRVRRLSEALVRIDPAAALPVLERLAASNAPSYIISGIRGMARIQAPSALPRLEALVRHSNSTVARAAIEALRAYRSPSIASALEPLLRNGDFSLAVAAAETLALSGDSRGISFLTESMGNRYPQNFLEAALALGRCSGESVALEALRARLGRATEIADLVKIIRFLGEAGDRRSVLTITQNLVNPWPEIRTAAAEALARMGNLRGTWATETLLANPRLEESIRPIQILAENGEPRALRLLTDFLSEPGLDFMVRDSILETLTRSGEEGRSVVEQLLRSEDSYQRQRATQALIEGYLNTH